MNKAIQLRAALVAEFDGTGLSWCRRNTEIADGVLRELYLSTCPNAAIAVTAVGGYGRRELGPFGDLDLVFLSLDEEASQGEGEVRALFNALLAVSDEIGWSIDYALRYPSDLLALDDKSRTALLDARLVAGPEDVFVRFMAEFNDTFPVARFLSDKRRERLDFRKRFGYTPRKVEFNIRDGAGGMRDYQAAAWFRKVLGADPITGLEENYDFMVAVRNALQITTERKEDRLLRTRHTHVASKLGSEPQRVFAKLMRSAELFQEEWRKALRLAQMGDIALADGVIAKGGACVIEPGATLSAAAAGVCRAVDLGIRVEPGQISNDVVGDGPAAADKLTTGANYLRALDRSGVLSALIPAFHDTKYLLPDDPVHEFTVGEHTLCVVDNLDELRSAGEHDAAWSDADHRALYLAAILHDLGKADTSAPHSVVGEDLSRHMESRLGLQPHEGDEIAWLVREHLTLARMARTHDLQSPGTPLELARICGTQPRLAMLYLLTIADIGAVSSETLTPHGLHSMRDLYEKARTVIGVDEVHADPAVYRSAALEKLRKLDEGAGVQNFLESMPTHYLIGTARESFPLHAEYVRSARAGEMTIVFDNSAASNTTEITICCADLSKPGLLSRMLGVIYAHDLTVHGVRAASTEGKHIIALDQITTSYRKELVPKNLSGAVSSSLKVCLTDEDALEELLRKHNKDPDQRQQFLNYRFVPGSPSVLEIETPIGRGMPYRVTKMLAHFGWNVYVARMGQWAGRAVARFYLADPDGPLTESTVATAISAYRGAR